MKFKTLFYLILLTLLASLVTAMHAQTFSVIHSLYQRRRRRRSLGGSDDTGERTLWNDSSAPAAPCIN